MSGTFVSRANVKRSQFDTNTWMVQEFDELNFCNEEFASKIALEDEIRLKEVDDWFF